VVSGAAGFLGSRVVRALREQNAQVVAVSRRPIEGGLQLTSYADAPSGEVLIHLAEANDRQEVRQAGTRYERAVQETLQALIRKRYRRIIYASSALLYGDRATTPRRETDAVYVSDAYTRVKWGCEQMVLATEGGIAVRLANLYGKGMSVRTVLHAILSQIPGRGRLVVRDDTPVRDFVFVDDAAEALAMMALAPAGSGIFNVGSGRPVQIGALACLALDVAGESDRTVVASHHSSDPSHLVLDITRTVRTWNWQPATNLRDGIASIVEQKGCAVR
jgi:UDP-glucose 4-epimerase